MRAAAGALRLGHTVGAAITNRRVLGRTEAASWRSRGRCCSAWWWWASLWPVVLAAPIVLLAGWVGIALVVRSIELYRRGRSAKNQTTGMKKKLRSSIG